jgi:hypothetical protein
MESESWHKRLVTASTALAAAGILVCAAAVVDALVPQKSLAGFFVYLALIGLIVTGLAVAYVWLCNKLDTQADERVERVLGSHRPKRSAAPGSKAAPEPTGRDPRAPEDRRMGPEILSYLGPRDRYGPTLRNGGPRSGATPAPADSWHGQ